MFHRIKSVLNKVPAPAWFVVILGLGFLMRLPLLNGSFWLDEAAQVLESSRPFSQQLQLHNDFQPPLIHLLVFALLQVSKSEEWLRLGAALIPALVTLFVSMQIGRKYFSPAVGWLSGVLLATSSFHIFYSQELRPYSLPTMFALLSWWVVMEMTNTASKSPSKISWVQFVRWGLWSALGLYSSYLYPFVFLGQILFIIWSERGSIKKLGATFLTVIVVCLSFLPWLPSFFDQLSAGQQLRQSFPGWEEVVSFDQLKSIALTGGKFVFGVLDLSVNPFFISTSILIAILTIKLLWRLRKDKQLRRFVPIFLCWAVLPVGVAWLVSFFVPILQPKRVLFALPALYLGWSLLSIQGLRLKENFSQLAAIALLAILFALNIFGSYSYYTQTKYQRENWRELQQYISEKYNQGDSIVLFAFPDQFASWKWYNQGSFPTVSTGVYVVSSDPSSPERERLKALTDYHYILVFDYLRTLSDPHHTIDADLLRYGFQQVDVIPGNAQLGNVKVYARSRQIIGFSEYCSTCYAHRN